MDRNQTESNPIKPVETAGKNQKGASGLERGCVQSTSRSTWKSFAASGVFQQAGFAKQLGRVRLDGTKPRSGVSVRMRPNQNRRLEFTLLAAFLGYPPTPEFFGISTGLWQNLRFVIWMSAANAFLCAWIIMCRWKKKMARWSSPMPRASSRRYPR